MRKISRISAALFFLVVLASSVYATNGDNLIAIGPIARSMGGVGIAAPQDAISAVFSNPAAMCFSPYCPSSQVDFGGTIFMPHPEAKVQVQGQSISADSDNKVYTIPAIGLSVPISSKAPFWRFGLAAYGVSGLGVDYRGTDLDNPQFFDFGPGGQFPLLAGEYTNLAIMKFAPSIAFQPFDRASVGLALHVDYSTLDLRQGSSSGYGIGVQMGMIYKFTDNLSFGLSYISPQNITYDNVAYFDADRELDDLELSSPNQLGIGLAYTMLENKLLLETNLKWLNWSGANGYDDFDWSDQVVVAVGAQYKPIPKLALRLGYNFGNNPVEEHDNFNGTKPVNVQGKVLPRYYYETFRIVGFPAIVEHHITAGAGYEFNERFGLNFGYMHAFKNTIRENGTDFTGQPASLESSLSEDSIDMDFTWRF